MCQNVLNDPYITSFNPLNNQVIVAPGGIWQCLERISIVPRVGGMCRHLTNRETRGAKKRLLKHRTAPYHKELSGTRCQ